MNRVALVFPDLNYTPAPVKSAAEHLGLGLLAAILRKNNYEVLVINGMLKKLDPIQIQKQILDFNPFLAGFSPVSESILNTLEIIRLIKSSNNSIITLLGGHLATLCGREILRNEPLVDFILKGDAEYSLIEFLRTVFKDGEDPGKVQGLIYRDNKNTIVENQYIPGEVDLKNIPWSERDDLIFLSAQKDFGFTARLMAGRGCRFDCSFCTNRAVNGKIVRLRDENDVVREMDYLHARFKIKYFSFNDDLFIDGTPENTRWADNFTEILLKKRSEYLYRISVRADSFKRNNLFLLDKLVETGLFNVYVGLESGSQNSLDVYNKKTRVEDYLKTVELFKSRKINLTIGFIMFNPYSTFQDLRECALFLFSIKQLYRLFHLTTCLYVYPNTPIAKRLKKDKLLISDSYLEPLTCYCYVNERVAYLAAKMRSFYSDSFDSDDLISAHFNSFRPEESGRETDFINNMNSFNKEMFLHICLYTENSKVIDENYVSSFFCDWKAGTMEIITALDLSVS